MLGGMQSHLDSSVVRIRHIGMVVGECLSARMDIGGTKLKFEVRSLYNLCDSVLPQSLIPPPPPCCSMIRMMKLKRYFL